MHFCKTQHGLRDSFFGVLWKMHIFQAQRLRLQSIGRRDRHQEDLQKNQHTKSTSNNEWINDSHCASSLFAALTHLDGSVEVLCLHRSIAISCDKLARETSFTHFTGTSDVAARQRETRMESLSPCKDDDALKHELGACDVAPAQRAMAK